MTFIFELRVHKQKSWATNVQGVRTADTSGSHADTAHEHTNIQTYRHVPSWRNIYEQCWYYCCCCCLFFSLYIYICTCFLSNKYLFLHYIYYLCVSLNFLYICFCFSFSFRSAQCLANSCWFAKFQMLIFCSFDFHYKVHIFSSHCGGANEIVRFKFLFFIFFVIIFAFDSAVCVLRKSQFRLHFHFDFHHYSVARIYSQLSAISWVAN